MINLPNLLLVSGSNRNVGKTTFICKVINQIAKAQDIYAIKITPHFHNSRENKRVILSTENVFIAEELDQNSQKDSSLMIQAGAKKVFYIEVQNDNYETILEFVKKFPKDIPIICESASLRKFVQPGLFILIDDKLKKEKKPIFGELFSKADLVIDLTELGEFYNSYQLTFEEKWKLNVM